MKQRETPKAAPQKLVRIYAETKKDLEDVVRELGYRQHRTVSEIEVADPILKRGLKREKRKLGIA